MAVTTKHLRVADTRNLLLCRAESQDSNPYNGFQITSDSSVLCEDWENQNDFFFYSDYELFNNVINVQSQLASAACKAQRAKFRFPREDPPESDIIDTRSDFQKMQDILRTWSQCLNQEETDVWNQICERNLSLDISLKSGQSIIKEEIRDFQNTSTDQKSKMLQILKNVPSLEPSNEQPSLLSHGNSQSVDPSCNPEPSANVLLPNDPPGVTHLASEILSHYIDPVSE